MYSFTDSKIKDVCDLAKSMLQAIICSDPGQKYAI